jgi:DNA-binding SARP family transcriptional activator/TolB-like protein
MSTFQPPESIVARLRTLGALELTGVDGRPIGDILSRQRRAALLVYLAVEGHEAFTRRDVLCALFWPEMDEPRARAALRQALYVLRSEVGLDLVVTRGSEDVGISPALACDAVTFARLVDDGRHAEALATYRGAFLSGFFIPDAPEFGNWVEERRAAFKRSAVESAKKLAATELKRGDAAAAALALRQAVALEPTDERAVAALMAALGDAGDRIGAIREYETLVANLDRDLGIEPTAETSALAASIRDGTRKASPQLPQAVVAPRESAGSPVAEVPRAAPVAAGDARPVVAARGSAFRWWPLAAALVVVIGALAFVKSQSTTTVDGTEPRLVVMPFVVRGGPELAYLGEGMADMLSTSLDGPDLFRSVPPTAVVRDVRARGTTLDDPDAAREVARRFGAERYVVGSVVGAGGQVRLDVRLFGAGATPLAQASVAGNPDSVFLLVDRVAAELIGSAPGRAPADRMRRSAALTTQSLSALRDYLQGERALRDGEFARAREHYRRAVTTDTGFALAYYRMSMAETWIGEPAGARDAAVVARRHATRLSARDRALLTAHSDMLSGRSDSAEASYRAIVAATPDDPEAWLQLGELLYHHNPARGRPIEESRAAFARVLRYDPTHRASLLHMVRIAATMRDTVALDSLAQAFLAGGTPSGSLGIRLVRAAGHRDRAAISLLARGAATEPPEDISDAARGALMHARDADAALAVLEANLAPSRPVERRALTRFQMAAIELTRGRVRAAHAHFAAAATAVPAASRDLEIFYALRSNIAPTRAELVAMRDRLQSAAPDHLGAAARVQLLATMVRLAPIVRLGLLSEVSARLGDSATAAKHLRDLEAAPVAADDDDLKEALLRDLRGESEIRAGRHAAAATRLAVRRTSDVPFGALGLPWTATSRINAGLALGATGRSAEARTWLSSLEYQAVFLYPFLGPATLELAKAFEQSGDRAAARAAYQRFIALWEGADASLQPLVEDARRRLSALGS